MTSVWAALTFFLPFATVVRNCSYDSVFSELTSAGA